MHSAIRCSFYLTEFKGTSLFDCPRILLKIIHNFTDIRIKEIMKEPDPSICCSLRVLLSILPSELKIL
jgi:hypothetical protein